MTLWIREINLTYTHIIPTSLVGCASRKALVSTTPARDVGISLFTTAPVGRASLCFKYHKAQTNRHLAPGCEDELSGLDPANRAAFSFMKAIPMRSAIGRRIGLCQQLGNPTINVHIGSDMSHDLPLINCVRKSGRTASPVRDPQRLAVGIATSMGGLDDDTS